ncbi:hypothetical protein ABFS83_08G061800 [Erythranthe nasuta]
MVCCRHRHQHFAIISFFILLISFSSHFTFFFTPVQGRKLAQTVVEGPKTSMKEDKTVLWRSHIGSRPPRCDRRCVSCTRCEAIQVPTNPQTSGAAAVTHNSSPVSAAAAARGDDDDSSNYKPLSWKCKCGNFIYNP